MTGDTVKISPADRADAIARFADALFPGDELFPSASAAGAHGVMVARLAERAGPSVPDMLATAFVTRARGNDTEAAARLEKDEPTLFETARTFLTFAYYEAPSVVAAIRVLGNIYNDAPQPQGYALRPFEPGRDAPASLRGSYIRTEDVVRVDLSGIAVSWDPA
jgi:hypothetical protein